MKSNIFMAIILSYLFNLINNSNVKNLIADYDRIDNEFKIQKKIFDELKMNEKIKYMFRKGYNNIYPIIGKLS